MSGILGDTSGLVLQLTTQNQILTQMLGLMQTGVAVNNVGASGSVLYARVPLTSAQLLALHSAPVTIVPAPGAGKYIQLLTSSYALVYGSATYVLGGADSSGLWYGNPPPNTSVNADSGDGFSVWTQTASAISSGAIGNVGPGITLPQADYINQPVTLWIPDANMTTGDGTGSVTVLYTILTAP